MGEYLIYVGAAVLVLVELNWLARRYANRRRASKGATTVSEMRIDVKADTQEAMDAISALIAEARQLEDLMDGRTVQSLATVRLSAGDTVVLMTDNFITKEQRESIVTGVTSKLPEGVKVMVLDGGLRMSVLTAGK